MKKETYICEICGDEVEVKFRHHALPKSKGGRHGEIITCCYTCNGQVHMLFSVAELATKTFEKLLQEPEMIKYIKWKRKHPGDHRHKSSQKVKDWKKYHQ
jgi:5-methylcytosine-specific restriction enzyme A